MSFTDKILINQTVTASGSQVFVDEPEQEIVLIWNISGVITGTNPTIQFMLQEVDPGDGITPIGQTIISGVINTPVTGKMLLNETITSAFLVSWIVAGITPSFGGVYLTVLSKRIGNIVTVQGVTNNVGLPFTTGITDGYNTVAVTPSNTAATSADPALVVAISPNNPITTSTARPSTSVTSSVAGSASSVVLLPANSTRLGATVYNDSSVFLYVKLGTSASTTDFTIKLFPFSYYETPYGYTGNISGVWADTVGFARVDELTP